MDGLYPIIRRVRRPLTMKLRPAAPAVVVSTTGQTASRRGVEAVSETVEPIADGARGATRPTVIGDSLKVIDRRNSEESKQHGGKASTTKKA